MATKTNGATDQVTASSNGNGNGQTTNGIVNYAARQHELDKQRNLDFYRMMQLIRRLEEKTAEGYTQGKVGGFLHLYIGEEAVATGVCATLTDSDHLFTHYRDHGYALAKGATAREVLAELYGKETGTSKGRGGSMHLCDIPHHFWGGYAIVGGHLPLATGVAQSIKAQGKNDVVVCVMGDGSTNIGMFHESLNMAALWQLPIVYLVENNLYAMGTALSKHSSMVEINQKGKAYGIPGDRFDAMDVWTVREHVQAAVDRARQGGGPSLIEAMTYRFRAHSMADPQLYREKGEVETWKQRDPIELLVKRILEQGIATEAEIKQAETEVETEVEDAVKFAEESPYPSPESLADHVYIDEYKQV